jgi:hypothetical protein
MSKSPVKRIAFAVAAAALATPAAQAGTAPRYEGYKSSYPQLHQLGALAGMPDPDLKASYPQLHQLIVSAGMPDPDLKSSYAQLHQALAGAASTPAAVARGSSGVDWRDAVLGALVGAFGVGLLGSVALRFRRARLVALR